MKFIFWAIQLPISYIQNCNSEKSGMHSISQIIQVYPRYIPNISITSSTGHIRFKPLGSKFTRNIARKFIDCYIFFLPSIYTNCQLCPTRTLGFFPSFSPRLKCIPLIVYIPNSGFISQVYSKHVPLYPPFDIKKADVEAKSQSYPNFNDAPILVGQIPPNYTRIISHIP